MGAGTNLLYYQYIHHLLVGEGTNLLYSQYVSHLLVDVDNLPGSVDEDEESTECVHHHLAFLQLYTLVHTI